MEIKVLASGSKGNCYWISDGHTPLLLECGIPFKAIRQGLDFKLSEVAGCLVSHSHFDHSKACKELMGAGVSIYTSNPTAKALGLDGHRLTLIKEGFPFKVGSWRVMPFDTEHDCEGSCGYLLANKAGEKLIFITDSYYCRYKFNGLTHIMIECNYASDILQANIDRGSINPALARRLLRSHFSLDNVKEFLRANDLSQVESIHLMHLSDGNSDEARFKREIQQLTGKLVITC